MPSRFTFTRRVAFAETDMAGIVHFANFYRYMEEAEHAFFRSVGRSISEKQPNGTIIGWPRVSAACSFKAPAYYEDLIEIRVVVERVGVKSLTMRYDFFRDDTLLAKGMMKIVCCVFRPGGPMESIPIPPEFAAVIEEDAEARDESNSPLPGARG
ncbi:MAG TPA: thioesterase family protein, partial [Planctomycetaceae bacterium]